MKFPLVLLLACLCVVLMNAKHHGKKADKKATARHILKHHSKAAKKSNTDDKAEKNDKSPGSSTVKAVEDETKSAEKEGSPAVEGKTSDKPHAKQTEAQKAFQAAQKVAADSAKQIDAEKSAKAEKEKLKVASSQDPNFKGVIVKGLLGKKAEIKRERAKQYLATANAAVNAAAEALEDAEDLDENAKKEKIADGSSKKNPSMEYLKNAHAAVIAAHDALAKASSSGGLGELPAANIQPMDTAGMTSNVMASKFTNAADYAVNAAEKALDNLAAVGYPDVLPSLETEASEAPEVPKPAVNANKRVHITESPKQDKTSVEEGEFIEEANNAVDVAHEALVQAHSSFTDENNRHGNKRSKTIKKHHQQKKIHKDLIE